MTTPYSMGMRLDRNGTLLTPEQWKAYCDKKGLCHKCETRTHDVGLFKILKPLTNEDVDNGQCLNCNPHLRRIKDPMTTLIRMEVPVNPNDDSWSEGSGGGGGTVRSGLRSAWRSRRFHKEEVEKPVVIDQRSHHSAHSVGSNRSDGTTRSGTNVTARNRTEGYTHHRTSSNISNITDKSDAVASHVRTISSISNRSDDFFQTTRTVSSTSNEDEDCFDLSNTTTSSSSLRLQLRRHNHVTGKMGSLLQNLEGESSFSLDEISNDGSINSPSTEIKNKLRDDDVDVDFVLQSMDDYFDDVYVQDLCCAQIRNRSLYRDGVIRRILKAMLRHNIDRKFLVAACGALWSLSSDENRAKIEIASTEGLYAIKNSMILHNKADILEWASGTLSSLSRADENKVPVLESGAIEAVIEGFQKYSYEEGVFGVVCRLFWSLASDDRTREMVIDGNVINSVIKAMERHPLESFGLEWACRYLVLMLECSAFSEIIWSIDIPRLAAVTTSLVSQHSKNCSLQRWAFRLLFDVLNEPKFSTVIRGVIDEIPSIIHSMQWNVSQRTIQELGCRILLRLSSDADDDKNLAIAEAGGLRAISNAMKNHPDDELIQRLSCCVLCHLSEISDDINHLAIRETDGIRNVVNAMNDHPSSALLRESCCIFLWNVSTRSQYVSVLAESGVVNALTALMGHYPLDANLQETACGILSNMSLANDTAMNGTVLTAIIKSMKAHPKVLSLQRQSCLLLGNLLSNVNSANAFVSEDGLSLIVRAMNTFSDENSLQEAACGALSNLSASEDDDIKLSVAASGGIRSIVNAMRRHVHNVTLQRNACDAFSALAANRDAMGKLLRAKVFEPISEAMKKHVADAGLQERACAALCNLAILNSCETAESSCWVDERIANDVVEAMEKHGLDKNVQMEGCAALWALSTRVFEFEFDVSSITAIVDVLINTLENNNLDIDIRRVGWGAFHQITSDDAFDKVSNDTKYKTVDLAIEAISELLRQNSDEMDLLINALGILLNLSTITANKGAIAVLTVIDSMYRYKEEAELQEKGCALLAALSTDRAEIACCIIESDGVDAIVGAMTNHSSILSLQSDACVALSNLCVDKEMKLSLIYQDGLQSIVTAMKKHGYDRVLQENAFGAIYKIISEADTFMPTNFGVVKATIQSMKMFPDSVEIQIEGMGILEVMTRWSSEKDSASADIDYILYTMKKYISHHVIQAKALTLLDILVSSDEKNMFPIFEATGIPIIINAMLAYVDDEHIQMLACDVLKSLSSNRDRKLSIRDEQGIDAIVIAMEVHFDCFEVQTKACAALANLAMDAQTNEFYSASADELKSVVRAMKLHPDAVELQGSGCLALRNFAILPENASKIRRMDSVSNLLRRAAQQFPVRCREEAEYVLALCA